MAEPARTRYLWMVVGLVMTVAYTWVFSPSRAVLDYELESGMISREGVISPVEFEVPVTGEELEARRSAAADGVPVYLRYDESVWPRLERRMEQELQPLLAGSGDDSTYARGMLRELGSMYDRGVVSMDSIRLIYPGEIAILSRDSTEGSERSLGELGVRTLAEARSRLLRLLTERGPVPVSDSAAIWILVPNVRIDRVRRDERVEAEMALVSVVDTMIRAGDTLVRPGGTVTATTLRYLAALRDSESTWLQERSHAYVAGRILLILLLLTIAAIYVHDQMPEAWGSSSQALVLSTAWLLSFLATGLAWVILRNVYDVSFASFVVFGAVLTSIFFHPRHGLVLSAIFAMAVAANQPHPYTGGLVIFAQGSLASYAMKDVRRRSSTTRSIVFSSFGGLAAFLVMVLLGRSFGGPSWGTSVIELAVSPILGIGAAHALIASFESVFRVSTTLAIGEASDRQNPLLLELGRKAMGTWQHSQAVADLAAEAARAIGADSQLAEAGGLYHDIGKVLKPSHFIENVRLMGEDRKDPHDELTPLQSARTIISHVADGVRLARQHRIPAPIIDIIQQSHGTTTARYFLQKAQREAMKPDDVDPADFTYDGPAPQTREAAIVLLADYVESAVKALTSPTAETIEETVRSVIEDRDDEGQFDECSITRADLKTIEETFVQVLLSRHHERVRGYPGPGDVDSQHS
ncbi:HDIG domain-containing protein [Candidatus Fermentibacterales bacterium]|nr:HDIG domain-containing protein [Candidatus Fermentibacterales bacterium]